MVYNTQNHWHFGVCQLSGILKAGSWMLYKVENLEILRFIINFASATHPHTSACAQTHAHPRRQ
jgi:hypothetical protein